MFLKKVRICNFKSFHREEIEFLPGFNCITGPNGAGTLSVTEPKCLRVIRTNDLLQKGASTNITAAEVRSSVLNFIVRNPSLSITSKQKFQWTKKERVPSHTNSMK